MNLDKDTLLQAITYEIALRDTCDYDECPKFSWITLTIGYESADKPIIQTRLCVEHFSEVYRNWMETALEPMLQLLLDLDKREWKT